MILQVKMPMMNWSLSASPMYDLHQVKSYRGCIGTDSRVTLKSQLLTIGPLYADASLVSVYKLLL